MPPRTSWSNLIPGLIALSVLIAGVIAVLAFGGIGKVKGEKIQIHVLTDQARGVMHGTEVWLDGQKVGTVDNVGFRAPSADTLHRVVITAELLADASERLRHDSRIQVRPGGNLIGPVVVFMESGTPTGRPVRSGDTLRSLGQTDTELLMERVGGATRQLPGILADGKIVVGHARAPDGTFGAVMTNGLPADEMRALRRNISVLRARMGGGAAEAGRPALMRQVASAMARVDSVRALIAAPGTSLGRFRRDSTLPRLVGEIRGELDSLGREMAEAQGTLHRWKNDSALVRSIADARREMTLLFADLKRRPLRYIHF